jgi:hypothetical protein
VTAAAVKTSFPHIHWFGRRLPDDKNGDKVTEHKFRGFDLRLSAVVRLSMALNGTCRGIH